MSHLIYDLLEQLPKNASIWLMDGHHMQSPKLIAKYTINDDDGTLSFIVRASNNNLYRYPADTLDNFDLEKRNDGSFLLTYRTDLQENNLIDGIFEEDVSVPLTIDLVNSLKKQGKKVLVDLMDDAGPLVSVGPADDSRHIAIRYADGESYNNDMENVIQVWTHFAPIQSFDDNFDLYEKEPGTWVLKKL
jgi:hypothetical protein